MVKKARSEYWQEHIRQWEKSKLSQRAYAKKVGIDEGLFSKWKIRLSGKIKTETFVEIPKEIIKNQILNNDHYEIILREDLKISVGNKFNPLAVQNLVRTLQQI